MLETPMGLAVDDSDSDSTNRQQYLKIGPQRNRLKYCVCIFIFCHSESMHANRYILQQ